MKDEYRFFATQLKKFMDAKHINQSGIAAALNVSTATASDWCNGNKMPRMDKLQKLADILDVDVAVLVAPSYDKELELTADGKRTVVLIEKMTPSQQTALLLYARLLLEREEDK